MSTYVAVPRELARSTVSAFDMAVWCVLASHRNKVTGEAYPSRNRVMELLGRPGSDAGQVSRATARLEQRTGWLTKRREYSRGRWWTHYLVRLPRGTTEGEPYSELPLVVLDQVSAGALPPELLLSLLRWMDLCGGEGWTRDSLSQYVATFPGASVRTAKAHRSVLVRRGLLRVEQRTGLPTETRLPWVSTTGAESRTNAARAAAGPGQNHARNRGRITHAAGAESRTQPGQDPAQGTSSRELAPVEVPPVEVAPSPVSPTSVTEAAASGRSGETTREATATRIVAEQGGYADLLARRIVDRIQADVKPGNIEAYVRAFRPDDLRTWEQKVLGGGDPAPWDVPGARATATAADRRAHREVEQARKDEERRARDGSVPASAEVRARMADVARAAARAGTQAEAS